jgi:hypothetical protein
MTKKVRNGSAVSRLWFRPLYSLRLLVIYTHVPAFFVSLGTPVR